MPLSSPYRDAATAAASHGLKLKEMADRPLNHDKDQVSNIDPQLRRLDLKLARRSAAEFLSDPPAALLLGSAVGLLLNRKFALASLCAAGFVLRQAANRRTHPSGRQPQGKREREEIEFERRVLKAQRGDYGRLEMIPFK